MDATVEEDRSAGAHEPAQDVFETDDLDLGREFLSAAYGSHLHVRASEQEHFIRHARHDCGSFAVDDLTLGLEADFDVSPLESLAVFQVRTGWMEHQWEGRLHRTGPGDVAANPPPHVPYSVHVHNPVYDSVSLSRSLLERTAGITEDHSGGGPRFAGMEPASAVLANRWRSTVAHVRSLLETRPEAMKEPLVTGNIARQLAESALATFPNTGVPEPTSADGGDATAGAVRRGIAFMEANAHTDIGLADVGAAARVSPRALQIAFARHHTTTPFGALRGLRLDRAHFELLAADGVDGVDERAAVAAVAARWGFANPADFSACYRNVYGVGPEETLAI